MPQATCLLITSVLILAAAGPSAAKGRHDESSGTIAPTHPAEKSPEAALERLSTSDQPLQSTRAQAMSLLARIASDAHGGKLVVIVYDASDRLEDVPERAVVFGVARRPEAEFVSREGGGYEDRF